MDVLNEFQLHPIIPILRYILEITSCDLEVYGEAYATQFIDRRVKLVYDSNCIPKQLQFNPNILEYAMSARKEGYVQGVGLPGLAAQMDSLYQIHNLKELNENPYFADGARLELAANFFDTAITIPLKRVKLVPDASEWFLDTSTHYLLGVVVLYLDSPIRHAGAVSAYLHEITTSAIAMSSVMAQRYTYVSRIRNRLQSNLRIMRIALRFLMPMLVRYSKTNAFIIPEEPISFDDIEAARRYSKAGISSSRHSKRMDISKHSQLGMSTHSVKAPEDTMHTLAVIEAISLWDRFSTYLAKWRGGSVVMPKRLELLEVMNTFLGAFMAIGFINLIYDRWNRYATFEGATFVYTLAPSFGALATLLYGLPAAPLSQPRIVLLAHLFTCSVAVVVAHVFYRAADELLWLQQGLAGAIAISGMGALGIFHPPAGACCLIVVNFINSTHYSEPRLLFLLLSILFACLFFIFIGLISNNLVAKRSYPLFW